jgi:hypothetical protein
VRVRVKDLFDVWRPLHSSESLAHSKQQAVVQPNTCQAGAARECTCARPDTNTRTFLPPGTQRTHSRYNTLLYRLTRDIQHGCAPLRSSTQACGAHHTRLKHNTAWHGTTALWAQCSAPSLRATHTTRYQSWSPRQVMASKHSIAQHSTGLSQLLATPESATRAPEQREGQATGVSFVCRQNPQ